jgi:hypothetical protein
MSRGNNDNVTDRGMMATTTCGFSIAVATKSPRLQGVIVMCETVEANLWAQSCMTTKARVLRMNLLKMTEHILVSASSTYLPRTASQPLEEELPSTSLWVPR